MSDTDNRDAIAVLVNLRNDRPEFFVVPSRVVARKMDTAKQGKSTWYNIQRENVKKFEDKWELVGESDQDS